MHAAPKTERAIGRATEHASAIDREPWASTEDRFDVDLSHLTGREASEEGRRGTERCTSWFGGDA